MKEAIETFRIESPGILDQDLPPFVIKHNERAVIPFWMVTALYYLIIAVIVLELTKAFESDEFIEFDRGLRPDVIYAGMMQYDGDLGVPENFSFAPSN